MNAVHQQPPQPVQVSAFYNHEQAVAAALVLSSMSASGRYDAYDAQLSLLNGSLSAAQVQATVHSHMATAATVAAAASAAATTTATTSIATTTLPQVFLKPSPPQQAAAVDAMCGETAATTAQASMHLPRKYL